MNTNAISMTPTGTQLFCILSESKSIESLLAYIREESLFVEDATIDSDEDFVERIPYQIPLDNWNEITGWQVDDWLFNMAFPDGALFVDRYFDSDYKDYDSPNRFMYIRREYETIVEEM